MFDQITAEILTQEEPAPADPEPFTPSPVVEPEPDSTPTPVSDPEPEPVSAPVPPEVSAAVVQSPQGIWGVQIYTQHPDQLDVAVNGKAVWRGIA